MRLTGPPEALQQPAQQQPAQQQQQQQEQQQPAQQQQQPGASAPAGGRGRGPIRGARTVPAAPQRAVAGPSGGGRSGGRGGGRGGRGAAAAAAAAGGGGAAGAPRGVLRVGVVTGELRRLLWWDEDHGDLSDQMDGDNKESKLRRKKGQGANTQVLLLGGVGARGGLARSSRCRLQPAAWRGDAGFAAACAVQRAAGAQRAFVPATCDSPPQCALHPPPQRWTKYGSALGRVVAALLRHGSGLCLGPGGCPGWR